MHFGAISASGLPELICMQLWLTCSSLEFDKSEANAEAKGEGTSKETVSILQPQYKEAFISLGIGTSSYENIKFAGIRFMKELRLKCFQLYF